MTQITQMNTNAFAAKLLDDAQLTLAKKGLSADYADEYKCLSRAVIAPALYEACLKPTIQGIICAICVICGQ